MKVEFVKYQGAGNDFIICDMRKEHTELSTEQIKKLCDRRFGIGADGYMTLTNIDCYDFYMSYYNSDGGQSTMCGNGGRCIAHYAHNLGLGIGKKLHFMAIDGQHNAEMIGENIVRLQMIDVQRVDLCQNGWFTQTGSPHYVEVVEDIENLDLINVAKPIRERLNCNVNFVQKLDDGSCKVRTFERGVEDETYACGTGATAVAITLGVNHIHAVGGDLIVDYTQKDEAYKNVFLTGPAELVYKGEIEI